MLETIKNKLDNCFGEDFDPELGKESNGWFVLHYKDNPKSTKYYITFDSLPEGDFALAYCHETNKSEKFKVDFDISPYIRTKKSKPTGKNYSKERSDFYEFVDKLLVKKGFNEYLTDYIKDKPTCFIHDKLLLVPFFRKNRVEAVLKINKSGSKFFIKGSEPKNAYHYIRFPENSTLVYLCEGIKTGYAVGKGASKNNAVVCVGSVGNLENAIKHFKISKRSEVVLCAEKESYSLYEKLKIKYDCLLVGDKRFSDLHDYYKELGLDMLKRILVAFKQKQYIPLGIDSRKRVVCYMKRLKTVEAFSQTEYKELYSDAFGKRELPENSIMQNFYWDVRALCREAGTIHNYRKIKEGIFPYKGNFYYYDTENFYVIKQDKIKKIDEEVVISNELVLCKEKKHNLIDLEKVNALTDGEVKKLFEIIDLFNIPEFDRKMVIGWIIQSTICGGLQYRSPLWILGPTGAGKTQIAERVIRNFFVFYERKSGRDTTPKWIHREFHGKAIPLQRDEYDPSKKHASDTMNEMEAVRASSTERFPERGISAGVDDTTQTFCYCFSAFYTSIKKPNELSDADLARFVFVKMGKNLNKKLAKMVLKFEKFMDIKMKSRFLKHFLLKLYDIRYDFDYCMSDERLGFSGHEKTSYVMLMCCYNSIYKDLKLEDLQPYIKIDEQTYSRKYIECLNLVLSKLNYAFYTSKQFYDILKNEDDKDFCNERGFYIKGNKLYVNVKKGIRFLCKLFSENKNEIRANNLRSELVQDGKFFLCKRIIGSLKDNSIPRGEYLVFNWKETIKEMED